MIGKVFVAGFMLVSLSLSSSNTAFAQTAEPLPSFEVASIKPAAPMQPGRMMIGTRGGPGTSDPGQMTFTNNSLRDLIQNAYDVKSYQITGPSWIETERFDILAKVPKNTPKEQAKLMLQSLLADRFKLVLHHSSKELPMYALVVAKNGPKLKEAAPEPAPTPGEDAPGGPGISPGSGRITVGKDGVPQFPHGAPRGAMMMTMGGMNGTMHMGAKAQTMARFAETLNMQVDRPIVDMTGLTGKYDIALEFAPDFGRMQTKMAAMGGGGMMVQGSGGEGPGGGPAASPDGPGAGGPTIFSALQEQLGLKLEPKKGPVDILVIDSANKVPTEN